MPFTIEEIEAAYKVETDDWYTGLSQEERQKNPNYDVVMGYLTGQYNSLQGLVQDYDAYVWLPLINLLKSIEAPGTNDQLVLDLAVHPHMQTYFKSYFSTWVANYSLQYPDEAVAKAAIKLLHALKYTNDEIVELFCFHYNTITLPDDFIQVTSPLKDFLLEAIKTSSNNIKNSHHYNRWSVLYFYLTEEVRPDLAKDYAIQASIQSQTDAVIFFAVYRDGYYMPAILEAIRSGTYQVLKLACSLSLAEFDRELYGGLAVEMSNHLLEGYLTNPNRNRWESGTNVAEFEKNPPHYLPYSVIAFHILLKWDKEKGLYWLQEFQQKKMKFDKTLPRIVHLHLQNDALPFLQQSLAQDGTVEFLKAVVDTLVKNFDTATYLPVLWGAATNKSKPLKETIAHILTEKDGDAEAKAISLLSHKKTEARLMAAMVLSYFFDYPTAQEAMRKVLNTEVNEAARDIFLECIAYSLPEQPDAAFIQSTIDAARDRGKLSKPIEDFLEEDKMPKLYYKNGAALSVEAVRFLLYRMKRVKTMRSEPEAKLVISQLDKEKSGDFALYIIKRFIDTGGKPEHKYLLALAALIGNDEVADKIRITLNNWIEENRLKMAEHAVGALALIGSNKTLRWVEWYSRKYRSKKGVVGAAALAALEAAAEELKITTYELGDRIVPDFGFEGLFKNFTAGGESYRAFIDSNFKIAFFNDDNKKLKAIPSSADNELKEEFKAIAKEVRDVVKSQSSRLEYYLVIQRRWTIDQWQQFFQNNPIMFIYATKLLWGVYENNQLTRCFYCQEDTTLVDAEDNEIELPEGAQIGIVHPLQLSAEALQTWNQKFFDLGVEPVFPQLNRPIYALTEEDKQLTIVYKYDGIKTAVGAIKSTLEKHGWTKGPAEDAGSINLFTKDDDAGKVKAVLEVEGVFAAGFDSDYDPKLGRLYFLYNGAEKTRWFNTPNDDKDDRLTRLEKVPAVFYSEVIAGISAIKLHTAPAQ